MMLPEYWPTFDQGTKDYTGKLELIRVRKWSNFLIMMVVVVVVMMMLMTPVTMTVCLPVSLMYFEITVHYSSHFSLLAVLIERFHDFITSLQSTAVTVGLL
jgi:hypothetical protein